ncbi:2-oxoglutarate ferredoxin oxidoreductase, gamma subunit [Alkalithermobacter thermoalcaliphilus JW-YL-7 = DSM 7308]|uniref:2-oxoglutarate ferredoxin oxidoreductase, gamma subunit n=1 Tax=Alkalithermobacter thermoalcaliphilus JW-YL-7 = DSM 7308 TaxID=1121328 RepID=A0A150FQH8_CLOPD|nr:2-oxoglutarate synthase [[Clostridium] paradoxum JW-YL-7 = DSM 7308]SHK78913.1 2-oxoglutarate ferredoxin oxidoreductase, gamma subunit [[Clostridium] paradoxum JW-YL-7 = DSM 7308]
MKKELRLSGSGGQGLILAGIILAEAAINYDLNAVQTQSYGPEARGGASKAEVIISKEEINYPKVRKPDLLLCLTQKSYNEYVKDLKEDGILIVDSSIKIDYNTITGKIYSIPIIETAVKKVGRSMVANIVALGAIGEVLGIIPFEQLKAAVINRVPEGTEDLNTLALEQGAVLIREYME